MRIAIDARWIFPELSGVGACTRELIRHLVMRDRKNEYVLLFGDDGVRERTVAEAGLQDAPNVRILDLRYGVFSLRGQLGLPHVLRRESVDVYHSPNYMIPLGAFPRSRRGRIRCVVTIHDVIPLIFPDHAPRSRKTRLFALYRHLMLEVGRRAHAIIAVSQASRRDTIFHLRIPPAEERRVKVVYNGVGEEFTPARQGRPMRETRTVLYVGRADPYKNLTGLIRAFAAAKAKVSFPLRLTVAGAIDTRYPEARQLADERGLADAVTWTGYLSQAALVDTYRGADLLVQPSRYEGFGLQVLEAMACGIPVVCSNRGSLPEVAGDAALLCDPDDAEGMGARIVQVLTDARLREGLAARGLRRARMFTWARAADETLHLYEEVAGWTE